jgi:hypothetical protein
MENKLTDEARLKEAVEFNRSVKLNQARERVCEAALEWWGARDPDELESATDRLADAAERLAELEEQ